MRAYRIVGANPDGSEHVAFAGSQGDAARIRRELSVKHGLRPFADTQIEEVEVPTSKTPLLAFLNALVGFAP